MRILSWDEFDLCIGTIVNACTENSFCGVYGFPRGGLCLAVALSHSLGIPLITEPRNGCLVVDDVYETGKTLSLVSELIEVTTFVWISKIEPQWWNAVEIVDSEDWLVFPWEDRRFAEQDQKAYLLSRS